MVRPCVRFSSRSPFLDARAAPPPKDRRHLRRPSAAGRLRRRVPHAPTSRPSRRSSSSVVSREAGSPDGVPPTRTSTWPSRRSTSPTSKIGRDRSSTRPTCSRSSRSACGSRASSTWFHPRTDRTSSGKVDSSDSPSEGKMESGSRCTPSHWISFSQKRTMSRIPARPPSKVSWTSAPRPKFVPGYDGPRLICSHRGPETALPGSSVAGHHPTPSGAARPDEPIARPNPARTSGTAH